LRRSQAARAPHHHPREPPLPSLLESDDADVHVALFENAIAGEQTIEVIDHAKERIAPCIDIVDQLWRQVLMHAAGTKIIGVHAAA